jgi:tRNA (guanine-N7-)-methyltransferase
MHARDADGPAPQLDTERWFGRSAPVVLEIGCGTGTSTLAMAQAEPHLDVVAVEVYRRGLAQLLSAIDRENVPNIRLVRGDGVDVLEHMFGPDSLTGVRVFFPDPWPKTRHHKRRFISPVTLGELGRVLKPGASFKFASDIEDYANWTLAHIVRSPDFRFAPERPGIWHEPWPGWVPTRYEDKARLEGRTRSFYFEFTRR